MKNIIKASSLFLCCAFLLAACSVVDKDNLLKIAENGTSEYSVAVKSADGNVTLAAEKLKTFIKGVSGAALGTETGEKQILLLQDEKLSQNDYSVTVSVKNINVSGGSGIAVYYAAAKLIAAMQRASQDGVVCLEKGTSIHGTVENVDNSALIPPYEPAEEVKLVKAYARGKENSPEWIKNLVMVELRIETATQEGTLEAAVSVLDRLASVGVSGIWVCPIYNGDYSNDGPQSVNPLITGTTDYTEGWKRVAAFVEEAHKRNIRVFFDVISWGVKTTAPILAEHPDWFSSTVNMWNGYDYNFKNAEAKEWFISSVCDIVKKTNADGFRCDLEPGQTGYKIYDEVRTRLYNGGYKIAIFSEGSNQRINTYDFEQIGVTINLGVPNYLAEPNMPYLNERSVVECVKKGLCLNLVSAARYNTYCVSNHDFISTAANKSRLMMGYSAILSPSIPLWFLGEEYGALAKGTLYFNLRQNLSLLENAENYAYYNDVKKYIKIKYTYPEIFCSFTERYTQNPICDVPVSGTQATAYARFAGNRAVVVAANTNEQNYLGRCVFSPSFADMGLDGFEKITITDLMTGEALYSGSKNACETFTAYISYNEVGVYEIKGE